jgi:hypothetical protein
MYTGTVHYSLTGPIVLFLMLRPKYVRYSLASELVRSNVAVISSNRNVRDSTKYKPTSDSSATANRIEIGGSLCIVRKVKKP